MIDEIKSFAEKRKEIALAKAREMKYHSGGNAESGMLAAYAEAMHDVLRFIEYREGHPNPMQKK